MPGWKPLIVCDPVNAVGPDGPLPNCDFNALMQLIANGIHDMVLLSTLVVVLILIRTGILWLTSGGDTGKHKQALEMFRKVVIGYLWILGAWLIVYTISNELLKEQFRILGAPGTNP